MLPEPEDDFDRKTLAHIREVGWSSLHIPADEEGPGYAYTVGLFHTWEHPELLVMGLALETAHDILTVAADRIREGHRYEAGQRSEDFVYGHSCRLLPIPAEAYPDYLGYGLWLYSGAPFPALRIQWPDREGRYLTIPTTPAGRVPR